MASGNTKVYSHFGKPVWPFHIKLSTHLKYNSVIPLLDIYLRGVKTHAHTKTFTCIFLAVLFMIARKRENNPNVRQLANG